MRFLARILAAGGRREHLLVAPWRRLRLRWFLARLRLHAMWRGADLELDVAPDLRLGRRVQVRIAEWGSRNRLRIGPGSHLDDDVQILLKGGTVELRERVELRRGTLLNVAGHLVFQGDNILSWWCNVHCSNSVRLGRYTSASEGVSLVDSSHFFTEPEAFFYHNVRTGTLDVGDNTWIAAKATLTRGSRVGSWSIVGASSVVTGQFEDGVLISGIPAEVVRRLHLPWERERLTVPDTPDS